jgi:hypothetical protein
VKIQRVLDGLLKPTSEATKDPANQTVASTSDVYDLLNDIEQRHTEHDQYGYDDLNRLIGSSVTGAVNDSESFGYDGMGNRTSYPHNGIQSLVGWVERSDTQQVAPRKFDSCLGGWIMSGFRNSTQPTQNRRRHDVLPVQPSGYGGGIRWQREFAEGISLFSLF